MARYAIGDIHGGSKTLRALLARLALRHSDRLYLLGDYVDRGNDSKGVLDIILDLHSTGFDIRPIRGNHDDMFLRYMTGLHDLHSAYWYTAWGENTLASFRTGLFLDVPERYLTLIGSMPAMRLEHDYVLVHAALDMSLDDPISETPEKFMMWGEIDHVDSARIGGRTLVSGHRIKPLQTIIDSLATNRIFLDNGACTNRRNDIGNLIALDLDTRELHLQPWLDG